MENTIAVNIANFLKDFKPFSYLTFEELTEVSKYIRVIHLDKNETIFQANDVLHDCFYVVNYGIIHLSVVSDAELTTITKCYPGQIFGLRPLFAKNNYQMTAKANEECVAFAIPIAIIRPLVINNSMVLNFLLESFASHSSNSTDKHHRGLIYEEAQLVDFQNDVSFIQTLVYNKNALVVQAIQTIKEVALLMTDMLLDNAFVIENNQLVGIVTDADFRYKVATGKQNIQSPIKNIMTFPVITVTENISLAEAQLVMLSHKVHHLCVTVDGTPQTNIKGVITQNDLIQAQATTAGVLIKEVKRANSASELKAIYNTLAVSMQQALTKNIPLQHLYHIAGEIVLSMISRAIDLAILELGSPPSAFAFLSIGSQGRREQLLLTDHDNMLIYEDVEIQKNREVRFYFSQLSKKVAETLEKIGYKHCPYGNSVTNEKWCKSISEWKKQYQNWITSPGEYSSEHCSIFFDYEYVYGDQNFESALTELIANEKNKVLFLDYLGNDALKKPAPLNFFKKFIEEDSGPFSGKFNIKEKAINKIVDIARLLSIHFEIKGINNTYSRYKELVFKNPENAEVYRTAAEVFLLLSKYRNLEGLKNDTSGEYIDLHVLSKLEKERLKEALNVLKDLEQIVKDNFQLTQFS